jgi:hypothetical protein
MHIRKIQLVGLVLCAFSLVAMEKSTSMEKVVAQTMQNENYYNQVDCRPFVTLTALQTAPRFYSLEGYVAQLTQGPEEKIRTENGWYQRLDPARWHMSLITLALPLSDELMQLSRDETMRGKFVGDTRKYADKALKDLAEIVGRHVGRLKGIEFQYKSIGGIGTNKFIAAYFGFKNPKQEALYHQVYTDIISDFLEKYPMTWMRYGFEFLPHVSVMKKSTAPGVEVKKVKVEGALCKGSGSGTKKTPITIAPMVPVIQNLELLFNGRYILVSAKTTGYPVAQTHAHASRFVKKGELAVEEDGEIHEL